MKLMILTGAPGSGKSTWANQQKNAKVISRDTIRFSLLSEDDEYFSKENEVLRLFYKNIQDALDNKNADYDTVIADASHLTSVRRYETIRELNLDNLEEVINVQFIAPIEVCIARNANRTGRANVPNEVIRRMRKSQILTQPHETYFTKSITINERGEENDLVYQ
jgi:predicted kinase